MNPLVQAHIREQDCIGCTKCIQACPYDAILGAAKLMHTVLIDECTGCGDCVAPCPVDCIELIPRVINKDQQSFEPASSMVTSKPLDVHKAEKRRLARTERLEREQKLKSQQSLPAQSPQINSQQSNVNDKKMYILEAIQRAKLKKQSQR